MKKRILALLLGATMVVSSLTGCGQAAGGDAAGNQPAVNAGTETGNSATDAKLKDAKAKGITQVGIVLPTKDEPRWLQDQKQFEKILGDKGFTSSVLFSQGSSATERTNVESLVAQGVQVLVICAQDATAAASAVDEAKSAGIQVICYDRLITDTESVDYYVTFNSVAVGEAQGQYLIDNAPAGSDIPLYLYAGAATDNNAFLFFQGAWNVLQPKIADGTFKIANSSEAEAVADKKELSKDEQSKILGQITTDWDFNKAKSKAEANLTSADAALKGDVVILAPNDGTARAIADAFGADSAITSYVITGQDAEVASINYIQNGFQSMTVFKNTSTLAEDACTMAMSIIAEEEPATDTTYNNGVKDVPAKETPVTVVTKDNYKEILVDSGYYTQEEIDQAK